MEESPISPQYPLPQFVALQLRNASLNVLVGTCDDVRGSKDTVALFDLVFVSVSVIVSLIISETLGDAVPPVRVSV